MGSPDQCWTPCVADRYTWMLPGRKKKCFLFFSLSLRREDVPSDAASHQHLVDETREALAELGDLRPGWQQLPMIRLGCDLNRYLTTSGLV